MPSKEENMLRADMEKIRGGGGGTGMADVVRFVTAEWGLTADGGPMCETAQAEDNHDTKI